MVDPEIPVLTIADLGVLRDVRIVDGFIEATITPTYSGCPAMNLIALNLEVALERSRLPDAADQDRAVAGLDHGLDDRKRQGQARRPMALRRRTARRRAARCSARTKSTCPRCQSRQHRTHFRIRLDRLQGAVALQGLRRAVRLFQVHLMTTIGMTAAAISFPSPADGPAQSAAR